MSIWRRIINSRGLLAWTAIIFTLTLFFPIGNADAAEAPKPAIIQKKDFGRIHLDSYAQILKDEKGTLLITDVLNRDQDFTQNTFGHRNLPNNDVYWQRFVVQNARNHVIRAVLSHEYPIVKKLEIYKIGVGQPLLLASKEDPDLASAKSLNFRNFSIELDLDPGINYYYIKTSNPTAPQSINFVILDPSNFTKMMLRDNALIFALLGIVSFSILYNIFIYIQLRHFYYVPYILFLLFMCFSQLVDRGLFHSTFSIDIVRNHAAFLIAFGSAAATAFEIIFILQFLNLKEASPRWYRITNGLKWAFIATTLVAVVEYWINGTLTYSTGMTGVFGLISIPIFIVVPAYLSFKGYKPAKYFALATFAMLLFSLVFMAEVFGAITWKEHWDLLVMAGTATQAILLSIALGHKLRIESDELNAQLELHVRDLDLIVAEKTGKIRSILDNVKLGIFRINREMKIDPEYSKACKDMFPGPDLAGADAVDALVYHASGDFGKEQASLFKTALEFSLDQNMISYDINSHALPKDIVMKNGKYLEMDWTPIPDDDGNLAALLVSAKDVTYVRELEISRERSLEEAQNLMNIIKHGQAKMTDYIRSERGLIQKTSATVMAELSNQENRDSIGMIMRNVHTIKGNARSFGLNKISNLAHECESQVLANGLSGSNRTLIQNYLTDMDKAFQGLQVIIDKYVNAGKLEARDYQDQVIGYLSTIDQITGQVDSYQTNNLMQLRLFLKKMTGVTLDELLAPMKSDLDRLCGVLGKGVPSLVISDDGYFISNDHLSKVRSVLNHIIKNSLDHGLEPEAERLTAGKSGHGKIVISLTRDASTRENPFASLPFILEFYDDGRGLDVGGILKKAKFTKLMPPERSRTVRDAANIIFQPGFSSKSDVTDISGRGIGMDAIKEFIQEIGGTVAIEFFDRDMENHVCESDDRLFVPFKLVVKLPAVTCV